MVDSVNENKRRAFRQPLDLPVQVHVQGTPAAVFATIVDLSIDGCRVSAPVLLQRGRKIEFTWSGPSQQSVAVRGSIVERYRSHSAGGPFEYGVTFDSMPVRDRDVLGRDIAEYQRRSAMRKSSTQSPATPFQRRSAYRAPIVFDVSYRSETVPGIRRGRATDISAGGLRLMANERHTPGEIVELQFRLPSDVLSAVSSTHEAFEITPFGMRRVRRTDPRRPFEEMRLRARVVEELEADRGHGSYGLEFVEMDAYTTEEIARFTHAAQLKDLRH